MEMSERQDLSQVEFLQNSFNELKQKNSQLLNNFGIISHENFTLKQQIETITRTNDHQINSLEKDLRHLRNINNENNKENFSSDKEIYYRDCILERNELKEYVDVLIEALQENFDSVESIHKQLNQKIAKVSSTIKKNENRLVSNGIMNEAVEENHQVECTLLNLVGEVCELHYQEELNDSTREYQMIIQEKQLLEEMNDNQKKNHAQMNEFGEIERKTLLQQIERLEKKLQEESQHHHVAIQNTNKNFETLIDELQREKMEGQIKIQQLEQQVIESQGQVIESQDQVKDLQHRLKNATKEAEEALKSCQNNLLAQEIKIKTIQDEKENMIQQLHDRIRTQEEKFSLQHQENMKLMENMKLIEDRDRFAKEKENLQEKSMSSKDINLLYMEKARLIEQLEEFCTALDNNQFVNGAYLDQLVKEKLLIEGELSKNLKEVNQMQLKVISLEELIEHLRRYIVCFREKAQEEFIDLRAKVDQNHLEIQFYKDALSRISRTLEQLLSKADYSKYVENIFLDVSKLCQNNLVIGNE